MLTEFFLGRARIELSADGLSYAGSVPELPEIHVEAATPEQCQSKLAEAITRLLAKEAGQGNGNNPGLSSRHDLAGDAPVNQARHEARPGGDSLFEFADIVYEKREQIARVTINRPSSFNAYTRRTLEEMAEAFRLAARDGEVAALVLTGAGDKAFCAGSDVTEHSREHINNPDEFRRWYDALIEAHLALRRLGKPAVARVNGIAAGGGNGWNLACDLAIAADHAKFAHVEAKFGMVAAGGPAQWLPLVVGERRAREMLLTCEPVSANKALLWGLVNDVVPYAELDNAVDALCRKLIDTFPDSVRYAREQLSLWKDFAWKAGIEQDRDWLASQFSSEEAREGLRALAERREVDYRAFRDYSRRAGEGSPTEKGFELGRVCSACGAGGFPAPHHFCGVCGEKLV
ncbi:MAG TPA: enoyl-CoA hydratase/isomerase family protein [Blastocatellia bacterium]|nr:enoyl-CoA hydratase/isomerase family protein [Blastocatellia bacterium]